MSKGWRIALITSICSFVLLFSVAVFVWLQWRWTHEGADGVRLKIAAVPTIEKTEKPGKKHSPQLALPIEEQNKKLQEKLQALEPKGINVVVDTAANRLYLRNGSEVTREAIVSCGSGNILPNPNGKEWVFDSPRGERTVGRKVKGPVWTKPDWAYVEEGKPIPKKNDPDRYETNVLGDYALDVGNGFLLHGTLYKRMLGRNVTHGCVRIGDEDLEALYKEVPVGSKVYFY